MESLGFCPGVLERRSVERPRHSDIHDQQAQDSAIPERQGYLQEAELGILLLAIGPRVAESDSLLLLWQPLQLIPSRGWYSLLGLLNQLLPRRGLPDLLILEVFLQAALLRRQQRA